MSREMLKEKETHHDIMPHFLTDGRREMDFSG